MRFRSVSPTHRLLLLHDWVPELIQERSAIVCMHTMSLLCRGWNYTGRFPPSRGAKNS